MLFRIDGLGRFQQFTSHFTEATDRFPRRVAFNDAGTDIRRVLPDSAESKHARIDPDRMPVLRLHKKQEFCRDRVEQIFRRRPGREDAVQESATVIAVSSGILGDILANRVAVSVDRVFFSQIQFENDLRARSDMRMPLLDCGENQFSVRNLTHNRFRSHKSGRPQKASDIDKFAVPHRQTFGVRPRLIPGKDLSSHQKFRNHFFPPRRQSSRIRRVRAAFRFIMSIPTPARSTVAAIITTQSP